MSKKRLFPTSVHPASSRRDKPSLTQKFYFKSGKNDERLEYIESMLETLQNHVGLVDIKKSNSETKKKVIVMYNELPRAIQRIYDESSGRIKTANSSYEQKQKTFEDDLKKTSDEAIVYREYNEVFFGCAAEVPEKDLGDIAQIDGVYAIYPDLEVTARSEAVPAGEKGMPQGMAESREILRIDELHAMGIDGRGVKIAVIDTGIDYHHPDLKDAYKGGYDFVDNDDDPMETTYEDWKKSGRPEIDSSGSSYYTDHGTHVSGTVAATGSQSVFSAMGMAPKADLYVYRVLGPYGTGSSSSILAAINEAAKEGQDGLVMDIINLSLGAAANNPHYPTSIACNNAAISGTLPIVSAGNSGMPAGSAARQHASLGSPGTSYLAMTIAASQYGGGRLRLYQNASLITSDTEEPFDFAVVGMDYANIFSDNEITAQNLVYVPGNGYETAIAFGGFDGKTVAATTPGDLAAMEDDSLKGKILAIKRGGITFADIPVQAKRLGAGAILIVNSDQEDDYILNLSIGGELADSLPILTCRPEEGFKLALRTQDNKTAFIAPGKLEYRDLPKKPADFSSAGPVNQTIGVKPDIIAPGCDIMSTLPAAIANPDRNSENYSYAYGRMSGTSMSAPHMTGISLFLSNKLSLMPHPPRSRRA